VSPFEIYPENLLFSMQTEPESNALFLLSPEVDMNWGMALLKKARIMKRTQ
jgi:hypothetical protein